MSALQHDRRLGALGAAATLIVLVASLPVALIVIGPVTWGGDVGDLGAAVVLTAVVAVSGAGVCRYRWPNRSFSANARLVLVAILLAAVTFLAGFFAAYAFTLDHSLCGQGRWTTLGCRRGRLPVTA